MCVCVCGLLEYCFNRSWHRCRGSTNQVNRLWCSDTRPSEKWYTRVCVVCSKCCPPDNHYRQWERAAFTFSDHRSTSAEHNCRKCYCSKCHHYCTTSDLSFCTYCWWNFPTSIIVIIGIVVKDISVWCSWYWYDLYLLQEFSGVCRWSIVGRRERGGGSNPPPLHTLNIFHYHKL